mmetsp:Transcript_51990/g.97516  ORF Transcript_51990/g.97516 Transcript_51990/m.97516 type:complete len:236 (-) Transcript_51990:66-773(-)
MLVVLLLLPLYSQEMILQPEGDSTWRSNHWASNPSGGFATTPVVEFPEAFDESEVSRALQFFQRSCEENNQSFTALGDYVFNGDSEALAEMQWLREKMLRLAAAANEQAGWNLQSAKLAPTDEMTYDRFGPSFSDVRFEWHCDDSASGPRDISVVAYFTDPSTYEGGDLQMLLPQKEQDEKKLVTRRFSPGNAVAFSSKFLKHCVTPVTAGERRSLLLLCSDRGTDSEGSYKPYM